MMNIKFLPKLKSARRLGLAFPLWAILSANSLALEVGVSRPNYTLDVYKSTQVTAQEIDKKYGKQFEEIARLMLQASSMESMHKSEKMNKDFDEAMTGIFKTGKYDYAAISPMTYTDSDKIGFTVDLVDKGDKQRINTFNPAPQKDVPDPNHLVASWIEYEAYGFDYFFRHKQPITYKNCPAFHCIFGFEHPDVKKYGDKFNAEVPLYKAQLIDVLRNFHLVYR